MHQTTTVLDWRGSRFWLAALSLFTLAASLPLCSESFIEGHDILFHLLRIEGIAASLAGGDFPARLHSFAFNGYGVPTGYFYPDIFLYFPALLRLAGIPVAIAYNLYCFAINIITATDSRLFNLSDWLFSSKLVKFLKYQYPYMPERYFY